MVYATIIKRNKASFARPKIYRGPKRNGPNSSTKSQHPALFDTSAPMRDDSPADKRWPHPAVYAVSEAYEINRKRHHISHLPDSPKIVDAMVMI
jgi:hypothetical protein